MVYFTGISPTAVCALLDADGIAMPSGGLVMPMPGSDEFIRLREGERLGFEFHVFIISVYNFVNRQKSAPSGAHCPTTPGGYSGGIACGLGPDESRGRFGCGGRIQTCDPLVRTEVRCSLRYGTALSTGFEPASYSA